MELEDCWWAGRTSLVDFEGSFLGVDDEDVAGPVGFEVLFSDSKISASLLAEKLFS